MGTAFLLANIEYVAKKICVSHQNIGMLSKKSTLPACRCTT
jgi:hypothetical protein